jgi:hypothetical protein
VVCSEDHARIDTQGDPPCRSQFETSTSILICCLPLTAQEKGMWRAASSNAKSITGDIALSNEKITIKFVGR